MFGWLKKAAYRKGSLELYRAIRSYLLAQSQDLPDPTAGSDVTQWANYPVLDEKAVAMAAAAAISEPEARYSPQAVKDVLRLLKTITRARGLYPDYFIVMEAVEDDFKTFEAKGDMATGKRLRERYQALWTVLVEDKQ